MQINLITALRLVLKVRPFGVGNGLFESYLARFFRVPENQAGNRGTLQCIFSLKTSNITNQHIKPGTSCFLLPMILMQVVRVLDRAGIMLSYFLNATPSKNVVFDITNNKKTNITLYNKSGYPF